MPKLSSFKIKGRILAEAKKRKPKGIQIYEDFSKVTKSPRAQNKYAILVYDKLYTTG